MTGELRPSRIPAHHAQITSAWPFHGSDETLWAARHDLVPAYRNRRLTNPHGTKKTGLSLAFWQITWPATQHPDRIYEMGLKRLDAQIGGKFGLINNITGVTIMLALRPSSGRWPALPSGVGVANPAI